MTPNSLPCVEPRLSPRRRLWAATIYAACSVALHAQSTPAAPTDGPRRPSENLTTPDDDTLVLSPFVIRTEQERGYTASQTLAGNRLVTDVRDIGASISIYTKDMIDDLGITNLSDILVYGTGTELGGVNGNFSGNTTSDTHVVGDNNRTDAQGSARTRGLAGPNRLRNLFNTSIPADAYNSSSITVNRGPNAVLFGVGSPAGVIDTTLNLAQLNRNSTRIELRTDDNASLRTSLDHNQVLSERKVAFRLAALDDLEKFSQEPAFDHKERIYGALTVQPYDRTTIRASFETGKSKANRPITVLPFNSISPQWYEQGQPTFDWRFYDDPTVNPSANAQSAGNFYPLTIAQAQILNQIALVYNRADQALPNTSFKTEVGGGNGANQVRNAVFDATFNRDRAQDSIQYLSTRNIAELPAAAWPGGTLPGLVQFESFKNFDAFDWDDRMLDESSRQTYKFSNFQLTVEQLFWQERAGVEFAYNKERFESRNRNSFFQAGNNNHIRIDTTVTLPTGEPNPNLGRPYAQYGGGNWSDPENQRENFRGTAFLKFDFADLEPTWAKWLGSHTLTGLYEEYFVETLSNNSRLATSGDAAEAVAAGNPSAFNRRPTLLVYLGDSILNNKPLRLEPIRINPVDAGLVVNTTFYASPASTTEQGTLRTVPTTLGLIGETVNYNANLITSEAAVLQSRFLSNHLVTTVGWRRDESYRDRRNIVWNATTAPKVLYDIEDFDLPRSSLLLEDADDIMSYSAVLKWPQRWLKLPGNTDISFFYNESENFTPSGGRTDVFGNLLGSPKGETREFGLNVFTLNDRISIRANRFKTQVVGQGISATTGPYTTAYNNAFAQVVGFWVTSMNTNPQINRFPDIELIWSALPPGTRELWGWSYTGTREQQNLTVTSAVFPSTRSDTTDFEAEGTEIEVSFNPNRQWRFALNVAEQKTTQTNIAPNGRAFIERVLPVWNQLSSRPLNSYPAGWDPSRPDSELPANI